MTLATVSLVWSRHGLCTGVHIVSCGSQHGHLVLIDTSQKIQAPRKWTCQLLARRTPAELRTYEYHTGIWLSDMDRMLANV